MLLSKVCGIGCWSIEAIDLLWNEVGFGGDYVASFIGPVLEDVTIGRIRDRALNVTSSRYVL